ncbi:MAG: KpsF/GutQ family sugar-phosphate isomerase [Clostridiales bacterium]|jgi:arabinose-5-phosphate isomerase|nr:KpsF/GutQ family sugar-phosphate isomerase [Clostridiales bacterium]
MEKNTIIETAKDVIEVERQSLALVRDSISDDFLEILNLILNCSGRIVFSGMGKSWHIARKIAATMSSLGTPSVCIHPAEAMHGDLGMVTENDIVVLISYSGETEELIRIIPNLKFIGVTVVSITGNQESTISKNSIHSIIIPKIEEACSLKLAPTSSSTATLVIGDALAVTVSKLKGFSSNQFAVLHPSGSLGKKLLIKVSDIMTDIENCASIYEDNSLIDAIVQISKYKHGLVVIKSKSGRVTGVFSDGDLRRLFEQKADVYSIAVSTVMNAKPLCVRADILAVDAMNLLKDMRKFAAPVVDSHAQFLGMITLQDILKAGVFV